MVFLWEDFFIFTGAETCFPLQSLPVPDTRLAGALELMAKDFRYNQG
ncbi:MAG TPA: hypothetical protein VK528_03850 [Flavobacterium sp.]|nr:hypothetical protein [Flavobacterium sp.]